MELQAFLSKFREEFEDTDINDIMPETSFRDLEEWSSLTALGIIVLVKTQYNKTITGLDIRKCDTVEELFQLIESK